MRLLLISLILICLFLPNMPAQAQFTNTSHGTGDILIMLNKLNNDHRALYIAAHPDDENTRLITYLSKIEHADVAYISLNRGDGGQNMIGTEIGPMLGLLRTHELMAARKIDGGRQFFTRSNDFGYSKTHEETLDVWDEEAVLSDLVYAIRKFRPHVLINRFPPLHYEYPTHGHHSASAHLAEIAFEMAGDSNAFPEHLESVNVWQPTRLYWNTSPRIFNRMDKEMDTTGLLQVDVGAFIPALGKSSTEIAAMSRSQHKSQGFGAAQTRGREIEFLEFVKGDSAEHHLWENIDTDTEITENGEEIREFLQKARDEFDPREPEAILEDLLIAYQLLGDEPTAISKKEMIKTVVAAICGLHLETIASHYSAVAGDPITLNTHLINRSDVEVELNQVRYKFKDNANYRNVENEKVIVTHNRKKSLPFNEVFSLTDTIELPEFLAISHPFWLKTEQEDPGMYIVEEQELRILPEAPPQFFTSIELSVRGVPFQFDLPFQYKWTDRVEGEIYRDFLITPPVTVNLQENVFVFADREPREVTLEVKAWKDSLSGELSLNLPDGWNADPENIMVNLTNKGDEAVFTFSVSPPYEAEVAEMEVYFNGEPARSYVEIDYDHIALQNAFPPAKARIVRLDIQTRGTNIGYIMGPGDKVARNLEQISYDVTMINRQNVNDLDLNQFDAILIGIRAYNTERWLLQQQSRLMNYVRNGGVMIVQYQTTWGLLTDEIGPFPFEIGRDRVTGEQSPMHILHPDYSLFNMPNSITNEDFEGWVQERGLYFAEDWDDQYQTLFSTYDQGEDPAMGSLLLAHYGEGAFMYTGISFFRQLPAGVPGAFRLIANMISYEQQR